MAGLDRDKALDMALANIEKQYGKGSVMRLGDDQRPAMKDGVPYKKIWLAICGDFELPPRVR